MPFLVRLAEGAVRDLDNTLSYLDRHAGLGHANLAPAAVAAGVTGVVQGEFAQ